ncbi:serine/threonine-protein kinase [Streptomyces sp. NPDC057757]|uniref:serine/threonine-protein kinase n=1 Tax=Streptomyces sp. NPDC057757 TaxID=3346241 RepID=UPI003684EE15
MVSLEGGRYELWRRIGGGGMGDVWWADDWRMRRSVAVKLLQTQYLGDPEMQRRFQREWEVTGNLEHENVVRAYDCGWGEIDGRRIMYLVMERLDGMSLHDRIRQENGRTLPVEKVIRWGGEICGALEAAHANDLVHRDLKPSNVQITSTDKAVLLDFGIACFQEDAEGHTQITPAGGIIGTREYMSPEQSTGGPVSSSSDLYSLGCLLYAMLTGRPPFQRGDVLESHRFRVPMEPRDRRKDLVIPRELNDLVMDLLEKVPIRRPATAAEVRSRLERVDARDQGQWEAPPEEPQVHFEPGLSAEAPAPDRPAAAATPERVQGVSEGAWFAATGTSLLAGLGTFGLLFGAGGAGWTPSVIWGAVGAVVLFLIGSIAISVPTDATDEAADIALGCFGIVGWFAGLIGCVWLVAARGAYPWYEDFGIGFGLSLGVAALGIGAHAMGDEFGWGVGAGTMALLTTTLLGALGCAAFAAHGQLVWWSALLTGLGLWAGALAATLCVYGAAFR